MDKHIEQSLLLDVYGGLLTPRQRSMLEQSLYEDCTLSEIAEREGISRQGVRDAQKRGMEQLALMESELGIIERSVLLRRELGELSSLIDASAADDAQKRELLTRLGRINEYLEV